MTTAEDAFCALLKYEQVQRSHPQPRHNKTMLIQSHSEIPSQVVTDSLQQTGQQMLSQQHLDSSETERLILLPLLVEPAALRHQVPALLG